MRKQTENELQSEANAFTNLTRKLLAVPKKEIDDQKAKYDKGKERKNEKRAK
jgi:hypothetical protein